MDENTQKTVEQRVGDIIAEHLSVKIAEVTPEASLVKDLTADSLDIVEMIMGLEEEFDISIPDEDTEGMETVTEITEYVKKKLAEKQ